MKLKRCVLFFAILVLMTGCASSFVSVENQLHKDYSNTFENNDFKTEYSFHVME